MFALLAFYNAQAQGQVPKLWLFVSYDVVDLRALAPTCVGCVCVPVCVRICMYVPEPTSVPQPQPEQTLGAQSKHLPTRCVGFLICCSS